MGGGAARWPAIITRRPHVLDGLLDPALLVRTAADRDLFSAERLAAFRQGDARYEEVLDRPRIFAAEQKFLIGVRLLAGVDRRRAGRQGIFATSPISPISAALDAVMAEFAVCARHGVAAAARSRSSAWASSAAAN